MGGSIGRSRNPLVKKLSQFSPLSDEDMGLLDALCAKEERFRAGEIIAVEGDAPRSAFVVTHGMAFRYRLLPDGRRQILTFLIPGDFFNLHVFLLKTMDHSIDTIGPTRIAPVGRDIVIDIVAHHPRISAAFKARVAMAALSGEKTLTELSVEFGVHPTMISSWKQELVKRAGELFARGNKAPAVEDAQKVIDDLHRKIGQLQVECDFLAGQPAISRVLRGGR